MSDLDADGYPTEEAVKKVREWPWEDLHGLFAYLHSLWHLADWGWKEGTDIKRCRVFHISTAGWSGNETLIEALEANGMAWMLTWQMSRRGGHYEFRIEPGINQEIATPWPTKI